MLPRAVLAPSVAVGAIETCQRRVTDSDVEFGGCVLPERIGTNGRVKTGGGVVPHRCSANSGEMVADGVHGSATRKPMAKLKLALFWLSASAPMAMLKLPVVLLEAPQNQSPRYKSR